MTIIKIDADETLTPIPLDNQTDLKTGSWCVAVVASDEKRDFAKFTTLGTCRGSVDGRYRQFDVSGFGSSLQGAPVVDLSGRLAGFVQSGGVISITDLNDDLLEFMNNAAGVTSADDEERQKGRMGVLIKSINKDYAKAHGLPKSGLWVTHVVSESPAAAAGMKDGDLIVALNGKPLRLSGQRAYSYFMQSLRPEVGDDFEITVMRDGKEVLCKGTFDKEPEAEKLRAKDIGIEVKSITDADVYSRGLFSSEGVLITNVEAGSPAATSSSFRSKLLQTNDVIIELAGRPTPTLEAFSKVLDDLRREQPDVVMVVYKRGRVTGYAGLNLKIGENGKGGM